MRAAAVAWKVRAIVSHDEFYGHLMELIGAASLEGVKLLVLPELFDLELLSLAPDLKPKEVPSWLAANSDLENRLTELAIANRMTIVGSYMAPERLNQTTAFFPSGARFTQPKAKLTQYEVTVWELTPGDGITKLEHPQLGMLNCYESEFPEAARLIAGSGVLALAVPAFTETEYGHWRVRHSCAARAVENQIYVLHASLVGSLGREPVPRTYGSAAILGPCQPPFPANGVIAETKPNEEGLAIADLDFERLLICRDEGDVRNWNDRSADIWRYR